MLCLLTSALVFVLLSSFLPPSSPYPPSPAPLLLPLLISSYIYTAFYHQCWTNSFTHTPSPDVYLPTFADSPPLLTLIIIIIINIMAKTDVGFAVLTKPHYAIDLCSSPHHHGHHHLTPRPTLDGLISTFVSPSSSSSAPPLPVLCSAVSLSKDGHASKSLYPLRYVQTSTILSVYSLYSLVNPVVLSCLLQCCGGDCYSKCCSVSLPA